MKGSENEVSSMADITSSGANSAPPPGLNVFAKHLPTLSDAHKRRVEQARLYAYEKSMQLLLQSIPTINPLVSGLDASAISPAIGGGLPHPPAFLNLSSLSDLNAPAPINYGTLCHLYIVPLPTGITPDGIREMFGPFGPIKAIAITPADPIRGRQSDSCILEYEAPESTVAALHEMNAKDLGGGRLLKVARAGPSAANEALLATAMKAPPSRLFLSNLHVKISEAQIRALFEPFGTIVKLALIPDPGTSLSKGYGFLEFDKPGPAHDAMYSLNGLQLGGLCIKVRRCMLGGDIPKGMVQLESVQSAPCVMLLENMVGRDEVDDDLEAEVQEECETHGPVRKVTIRIEDEEEGDRSGGRVVISVRFEKPSDAEKARAALNGRYFGGRQVKASLEPSNSKPSR